MRLQVNKDWRSKWFVNKRDYAKYLLKLKGSPNCPDKAWIKGFN